VRVRQGIPDDDRFQCWDNALAAKAAGPSHQPCPSKAGQAARCNPSPAADTEPDGSTVVYFSPTQPDDIAPGNWIQIDPDRGWFVILRLYSPLQPFFDKTWRPGEVEAVG
jgi:hypothetical protein